MRALGCQHYLLTDAQLPDNPANFALAAARFAVGFPESIAVCGVEKVASEAHVFRHHLCGLVVLYPHTKRTGAQTQNGYPEFGMGKRDSVHRLSSAKSFQ
jgi:hypothetical protein